MKKAQVVIYLDWDPYDRLKKLSRETKVSMSEMIRQAIDLWLKAKK